MRFLEEGWGPSQAAAEGLETPGSLAPVWRGGLPVGWGQGAWDGAQGSEGCPGTLLDNTGTMLCEPPS